MTTTDTVDCQNILLDGIHCGGQRCEKEECGEAGLCCIHCDILPVCSEPCEVAVEHALGLDMEEEEPLPLLPPLQPDRPTSRPLTPTVIEIQLP